MVQHISNLVKVAGQSVERSTLNGLQQASLKSGVSFQYLVAKAAQESSLQTDAKAETSSATGLFQFTRGTWLDMMRKHGALYGYGDLAQKITLNGDGKAVVNDPAVERKLMALRGDAEASALMAAEYARDNATSLTDALGRKVDAPDLYIAHFLGANGASQLLNAAEDKPSTPAASVLPAAAKANTSVFYSPDGRARSASEVVSLIRERFSGQMDRYASVANVMSDAAPEGAPERAESSAGGNVGSPSFGHFAAAKNLAPRNDPTKAMINHFILEEMAKMIAANPMIMRDGNEDDENTDSTSLGSNGFQGNDWAAAMTRALGKDGNKTADQAALERELAKARAGEANRTYDMLNAVQSPPAGAVPFIPTRRNDPS
jgi:hypothetical protein